MNERIKQLEQQCWSHRVEGALVDGQLHFDTQKFAELIVRECVQACINEGKTYEVESAGLYQSNLYATAIKTHFGIKE
jgi:hypothetical protein